MTKEIELCQGCIYLERRWLMGMTWCNFDNRPRGEREVACVMKKVAVKEETK